MSTLPLSGVKSRFFSAFPLFTSAFLRISSWKKCALLSVKWNSDHSATSFQCSTKLIRSAKSATYRYHKGTTSKMWCVFPCRAQDKDIPGYRSSSKIRVAPRRCTTEPVAPLGGGKNTNSSFLRFFVRSVPLFRSLMLTPMH